MTKRVQLFIHKWYDTIKLSMIICILVLTGFGILNVIALNADESRERGEAVIKVTEQISRENDEQTDKINRQFQALCFIIIQTAGREALSQLDPPLEDQCRNLTAELKKRDAATEKRDSSTQQQQKPRRADSQEQPQEAPERPSAPSQPSEPTPEPRPQPSVLERVLEPVNNLLRGVLGR